MFFPRAENSEPTRDETSLYGYIPTEWIAIIFLVLFSISTLAHIFQALFLRPRLYFLLYTAVVAGILEILGWSGRLWSAKNPLILSPYLMQICCTIIAPTPLVAANFIILGRIIRILGSEYSRLGPKLYTIIFCSFDFISLVVQAVGGAKASTAAESGEGADVGGNIMLGGIIFQMVCITVYALLAGEFIFRYLNDKPVRARPISTDASASHSTIVQPNGRTELTKNMKIMLWAMVFNTTCLFIRAIYRTIELADGWDGRIITTEVYFNVLDGAMIVLAIFTLNFFHPSFLLYRYGVPDKASPSLEKKHSTGGSTV